MLAARVVMDHGVYVEGINCYTGFCVEGHTHAIRRRDRTRAKRNNALWVAEQLGIKLHIIDIVEEYKDILLNPTYGYGANLNPCLDCKVFMVHKAHEWMERKGFDFIVTGEVVGQRPMSQRRDTMRTTLIESGANDRLLRPLCARNLAPTKPEREGWVDRARLYGFSGRSRRGQMGLATEYGFTDYAQPAGGCCFLTDRAYATKLADLWRSRGTRDYDLDDIMLLKVGRHLRPRPHFKLIIGREEGENNFLQGYRWRFVHLRTVSHPGPLVLVDGSAREQDLELAGRIAARFSKGRDAQQVDLLLADPAGETRDLMVRPMTDSEIPESWYI